MSGASAAFVAALRETLAAHADATRAGPMQAYMKSSMPYLGIAAPLRRRLVTELVKAQPLPDTPTLAATMLELWRHATHREQRYAAAELARLGRHRKLADLRLLPVYEEMSRPAPGGTTATTSPPTASAVCCSAIPPRSSRCCCAGRPATTCGCAAPRCCASGA